ncbi:MFS-type transporter clz9-like [Vanessa cardui]|uniref:MFS-type transporter clz9-like n=1 Tax=Vanessa cardui TaxID=171605 RepID=UPI001F1389BF|nr:MFS-type transporter clz9-like [Vanessa cardui]
MVYTYKRKTDRANWSQENLAKAMEEAKKTSKLRASKMYGIPYATLHRHIESGSSKKKLGRFESVFTPEEEKELLLYVQKMDSLFYGLTRTEFLQIVGEFARKKGKARVFSGNIAGKGWFKNFKLRHPTLTLRSPEPTSIARVKGFNREAVNRFYLLLEEVVVKHNIEPDMIFNMDETGVRTSSTKPPKVLSTYGKKQVGIISSNEKGVLTTVVCCCSASGRFIPPFFIFKRKRLNPRLLDGAPPGAEATTTDSGWINSQKFLDWLQIFVQKVRPTTEHKALLILDNHQSHKSYEALDFATKNNIIFLSIPPHTSHKLQPLDIAVYGPIKKYFEIEVNTFQKQHPGRTIDQYDIAKLFTGAYLKGAVPANAISGFRASGIYPFNSQIIGDEHFAPSEVYQGNAANIISETNITSPRREDQQNTTTSESITSFSANRCASPDTVSSQSLDPNTSHPDITNTANNENSRNFQTPSTPDSNILQEIRPIPVEIKKRNMSGRKQQKSEILTSTPIKMAQKEKRDAIIAKKKVSFDTPGPSNVKMRKVRAKKGPSKNKENKEQAFFCTVCKEQYQHPPIEDWIQCDVCREWTHEACSSYSGRGSYFCDDCID